MIRSYGPGKFYNIIDSYVYGTTLDGCCEELGDEGVGAYILIDSEQLKTVLRENGLTTEERALVEDSVGAIMFERTDGIVEVAYFDSREELNVAWERIEAE